MPQSKSTFHPQVCVVIPNYNGGSLLETCIQSLVDAGIKQHHVIVVDNGSHDDSAAKVAKLFPDTKIIRLSENLGFAGGVNTGIRAAIEQNYDYVALLNNDAMVEKRWLPSLVDTMNSNPRAGIVAAKIVRTSGKMIDSTGECLSKYGMPFPRGRNEIDTKQYDNHVRILGASGGASLYRVKMFEQVGLFDERMFAYFEDVDISLRARHGGWEVLFCPQARVSHLVSATSKRMRRGFSYHHTVKNFLILNVKNMPLRTLFRLSPFLVEQYARIAYTGIKQRMFLDFIRANLQFMWYLPGIIQDRLSIQKDTVLSSRQFDELLFNDRPPVPPAIL